MWDNSKCHYLHIFGVPEEEHKENGSKKISEEIIAKIFPSLVKNINLYIQEAHWTSNKINIKKTECRHIIVILLKTKDKEENFKEGRENDPLHIGE